MEWIFILSIPLLTTVLWLYTVSVARSRFPRFTNKAIVLLIAHPDDEAMFFAPTLLALTDPALGNHVKILCLSSGDADGLGETRKKELAKSGMLLGLQDEDDVFVIEDEEFPDSMTKTWSKEAIANTLTAGFITPLQKYPSSPKSPPRSNVQILITFDSKGVSSHPNHTSLYDGAVHFLQVLMAPHPGHTSPIDLYTLTSLPIWRKYISIFDSILSMIAVVMFRKKGKGKDRPENLLFLSDPGEMRRAREAMWAAHKSQMRWFRWGWIGLSRYMAVNDLKLEKIK